MKYWTTMMTNISKWSTNDNSEIILYIQVRTYEKFGTVTSEIIDCWVELRAIRNALEVDKNDDLVP